MGLCASTEAFADYSSYNQLLNALKSSGALDDMELVIGIDATKSNEVNGKISFEGHSLHDTKQNQDNPYKVAISSAVRFLERDADQDFPLFYFGSDEANQHGGVVLVKNCKGASDLLQTYLSTISKQTLSGPTSFIPLINETLERIRKTKKYHILLILTDGAVTEEASHYETLNYASQYPLSIVCVGIGDGPWKSMEDFDDNIPEGRLFDNFQFVKLHDIVSRVDKSRVSEEFFFRAFMEVPQQYKAMIEKLNYQPLGRVYRAAAHSQAAEKPKVAVPEEKKTSPQVAPVTAPGSPTSSASTPPLALPPPAIGTPGVVVPSFLPSYPSAAYQYPGYGPNVVYPSSYPYPAVVGPLPVAASAPVPAAPLAFSPGPAQFSLNQPSAVAVATASAPYSYYYPYR